MAELWSLVTRLFSQEAAFLLAALMSLSGAIAAAFLSFFLAFWRRESRARLEEIPLGDRVQGSIEKLAGASREIDIIVQQVIEEIGGRERALTQIKTRYESLLAEEQEAKRRVETLKDIPIEVAQYFEQTSRKALEEMEIRSTRRDMIMFASGILVTVILTTLLRLLGVG